MYCSKCGNQVAVEAVFCSMCGAGTIQTTQVSVGQQPHQSSVHQHPTSERKSNRGLGFGIASLIVGVLTLSYGFIDYDGIANGGYSYIFYSEIGLLLVMSIVGITFGGISTKSNNNVGKAGLIVSLSALVLTLFLSQFGG